jgi:hypothetical protein
MGGKLDFQMWILLVKHVNLFLITLFQFPLILYLPTTPTTPNTITSNTMSYSQLQLITPLNVLCSYNYRASNSAPNLLYDSSLTHHPKVVPLLTKLQILPIQMWACVLHPFAAFFRVFEYTGRSIMIDTFLIGCLFPWVLLLSSPSRKRYYIVWVWRLGAWACQPGKHLFSTGLSFFSLLHTSLRQVPLGPKCNQCSCSLKIL